MDNTIQLTEKQIIARFEEAALTMEKLPPVKARGYHSLWPEILHSRVERLLMDRKPRRLIALPDQITRMEETIDWLKLLDMPEARKLVWMRAERLPWREICTYLGVSRTVANRRWKNALLRIHGGLERKSPFFPYAE